MLLSRGPLLLPLVLLGVLACSPLPPPADDAQDALGCTPRTCEQLGQRCGQAADGCGGVLSCGGCAPGETCSAGWCQLACPPRTCAQVGATCGEVPDGCGGRLDCGTCADGQVCGGGGPNRCGPSSCQPLTCAALGKDCGLIADGCGGLVDCGQCPAGATCGGGGVPNVCHTRPCTPRTCASAGADCGPLPDGCGGTLECGTCSQGRVCGGGGLQNVCVAPGAAPDRAWVRTLPDPVTALATDGASGVLLLVRTPTGPAPARLDAGGRVVWTRKGSDADLSLSGLSVAPGTGELLAWGWRDGGSGTGGATTRRFTAEGQPAGSFGDCGGACTLGPAFADPAGNLLLRQGSGPDTALHYTRPDGTGWALRAGPGGPTGGPPLEYLTATFDARAQVLVGALTQGQGSAWGRPFGSAGESHPVVLKFTPAGSFVWARELDATRARVHDVQGARDGAVVVLGAFGGTLRWSGEVLTTPQPWDHQTVLFTLDAGGYPRWLRALSFSQPLLAVSPAGRITVAQETPDHTEGGCTGVRVAEYSAEGRLLWVDTIAAAGCTGSLGLRGLAYAGEQVVLGGTLRGTVDFGAGVGEADADGVSGFVLKLQRP